MLVLTRKTGEAVLIGDGVVVRVLGVEGGRVRLGFEADPGVPIYREEVKRRIAGDFDHPEYLDRPLEVAGRKFAKVP